MGLDLSELRYTNVMFNFNSQLIDLVYMYYSICHCVHKLAKNVVQLIPSLYVIVDFICIGLIET